MTRCSVNGTFRVVIGVLLAGLAMSLGWGIRGDYGHEAGPMIPGALLGLSICLASGREDWWRRASLMGMCGAIGWAFGGQMSYGRITGYTASSSLPDVFYGYACLFVMMWSNLFKNVRNWTSQKQIPGAVLGLSSSWWLLFIGLLLSAAVVVALIRHGRQRLALSPAVAFGRGQVLLLLVTWIPVMGAFTQAMPGMSGRGVFLVPASFWITAGLVSLIAVSLPPEAQGRSAGACAASDVSWRLGRGFWIALFLTPIILYWVARLTVAAHAAPLPGSALRLAETFSPN